MLKNTHWLTEVPSSSLEFLRNSEHPSLKGAYSYSLSSDVKALKNNPLLGSSIFALKIMKILNVPHQATFNTINRIKSFRHSTKIYDPYVYKNSFLRNFGSSVKRLKLYNLSNSDYIRAETRQALSALSLYDEIPSDYRIELSQIHDSERFLHNLNWKNPWDAGSHFSHLMFNLKLAYDLGQLDSKGFETLLKDTYRVLNTFFIPSEGCWYLGKVNSRLKINGCMKIISGMNAAHRLQIESPKKIIDLCLESLQDSHACDNFNVIYVLKNCFKLTDKTYRREEILRYAEEKLHHYRKNFHPQTGGFSFHQSRCNELYYGAQVTKGGNCADIHGTVLFLWGISLLNEILDLKLPISEIST